MDAASVGMEREDFDESGDEQAADTLEAARLRRLLSDAASAHQPMDRKQLDAVFQRIIAQLEDDEKRGIPVAQMATPSGVARALTSKLSG